MNLAFELERTIGDVHGRKVLSFLPPGGRMLQWGAGESTLWFAQRLPPRATLTVVEHDAAQYAAVGAALGTRESVRLLLCPPAGPAGVEGPLDEQNAPFFSGYIGACAGERFDVVFIDGRVRGSCLTAARERLVPGGAICLHDGQRPWYDDSKMVVPSWGVVGAASAEDPAHLWIGGIGRRPSRPAASGVPVVISAVVAGPASGDRVRALIEACDLFGLPHDIAVLGVEQAGVAVGSVPATKAELCLAAWRRHRRPILWIDSDAAILARPELLIDCDADVALHRVLDWQLSASTLFFNHTLLAEILLERWVERSRPDPALAERVSLDLDWEDLTARAPLDTLWLPVSYCQMSSGPRIVDSPVIVHPHGSEPLLAGGDGAPDRSTVYASEAIYRARLAARPRQWRLPWVESSQAARECHEERPLDFVLPGKVTPGPAARLAGPDTMGWWADVWRTDDSRLRAEQAIVEACLGDVKLELQACRDAIYEAGLAELAGRLQPHVRDSFAIYGAGVVGQALLRAARDRGLDPRYFVESNPTRHGLVVEGMTIVSPTACRAAGCHVYAIGSYASVEAIAGVLTETYEGADVAPVILSVKTPRLPDVSAASRTLFRVRNILGEGRVLADLGLVPDAEPVR